MRSEADIRQEAAEIAAAQVANASQRDAFVALGHTVLITASIAFMGDVRPAGEVEVLWLLILSWAVSVIGLFALTLSFHAAHSDSERRRLQIHDASLDDRDRLTSVCNMLALWSFPVSMLLTVVFATINLWNAS